MARATLRGATLAVALALLFHLASTLYGFIDDKSQSRAVVGLAQGIAIVGILMLVPACLLYLLYSLFAAPRGRATPIFRAIGFVVALVGSTMFLRSFPPSDPYFWYSISAEPELMRRVEANGGMQAIVVLSEVNASFGLAINDPVFVKLIYDESDQIGLLAAERTQEWSSRWRKIDGIGCDAPPPAKHLRGHMFKLSSVC